MNLKEAIKHCYEVAEAMSDASVEAGLQERYSEVGKCMECARDHLQLAEWLEELNGYRKAHEMIKKLPNANPSYWHSCDVIDRADCLAIIDECIEVKNETDN